jgi:fused signal recognition particle receptor
MFSFFNKKSAPESTPQPMQPPMQPPLVLQPAAPMPDAASAAQLAQTGNANTSPPPSSVTPPSAQVWRSDTSSRHQGVGAPLTEIALAAPVPALEPALEPAPEPAPAPAPASIMPAAASVTHPPAAMPAATTATNGAPAATANENKRTWLARLKSGLAKTSANLSLLFIGAKIGDDLYDELESALLMADAGMDATLFLLDALKKKVKDEKLVEAAQVKAALKTLLIDLLTPLQKPFELGRHQPLVMMITGVNGAGKTTTIGKLAKHLQAHGQSVLLAAGDTFRAAAREQLTVWGQRNNVTVIAQESGDPAAVAFDAVASARARNTDVVMVDTAGRLPTQLHLMEELKKIKRVITKGMDSAPHEILLVIDGNTGQNALAQLKAFDDALTLTGVVITKLDGTAKGGVIAAIARVRPVPVYFIGVGEKIEDLQPFNANEFVDALLG